MLYFYKAVQIVAYLDYSQGLAAVSPAKIDHSIAVKKSYQHRML